MNFNTGFLKSNSISVIFVNINRPTKYVQFLLLLFVWSDESITIFIDNLLTKVILDRL